MSEARIMPVRQSSDELNLSWRDQRYVKFYQVVDELVDELQEYVWIKQGKRRFLKSLINRQYTLRFKQNISLQDYASIHATFFSTLFNS